MYTLFGSDVPLKSILIVIDGSFLELVLDLLNFDNRVTFRISAE